MNRRFLEGSVVMFCGDKGKMLDFLNEAIYRGMKWLNGADINPEKNIELYSENNTCYFMLDNNGNLMIGDSKSVEFLGMKVENYTGTFPKEGTFNVSVIRDFANNFRVGEVLEIEVFDTEKWFVNNVAVIEKGMVIPNVVMYDE